MNSIQPLPEGPWVFPQSGSTILGFLGLQGVSLVGCVQGPSCFSIIFLWTFFLLIEVKFTCVKPTI